MEAYEILLYPEGVDPSAETILKRDLFLTMMARAADLIQNGFYDVASRIKTEIMANKILYDSSIEHAGEFYSHMFDEYAEFDHNQDRQLFSCLRDIISIYGDELQNADEITIKTLEGTLNSYLKLKVDLDTVSPEISEEVERLTNMTEEEFAEEMKKEFGEEDEEEIPSHRFYKYQGYMTDEIREPPQCPPIASSEPADTTGFQPLTEPVRVNGISDEELKSIAPDTSKYDPEYDIPDEKLYDKHDD